MLILCSMCIATSLQRVQQELAEEKVSRVSVRNDTPIGKFKDFMRVGDNKKELFNMIADTIPSIQSNTLLIATKNEHVVSNKDINSSRLEMCNHEEADNRMFVHV